MAEKKKHLTVETDIEVTETISNEELKKLEDDLGTVVTKVEEVEVMDGEVLPPLHQIGNEIIRLAETGDGAARLRGLVQELMPKTVDPCQDFYKKLQRMRQAAEVMMQSASEAYATVMNKGV